MSGYGAKNYTEQGGEVTHIGGKLVIDEGGTVEGFEAGGSPAPLPVASADTLGGVKAKAKTTETVEVAADGEGRLYVPAYPAVKPFPQIARQADATGAEDVVEKYNALLAALRTAGLMSPE